MKFLALAALSVFGLVAAQDLTGLPTCAYNCALQGIGSTGCAVTNSTCICSAQSFLSDVQTCITAPGACDEADVQATLEFANNFCGGSVNGTNGTSSSTGTASSGTASATESSETGSSSSTESSSESSATSGASESSSETGSASGSSASAAASETSSGSFAAPTLAALGVAQLLGVAGVVVAAL